MPWKWSWSMLSASPLAAPLRLLWKARRGGRASPVLLVALNGEEYGPAKFEPRHPDVESGRPWPSATAAS